jgi:hypothetical protein
MNNLRSSRDGEDSEDDNSMPRLIKRNIGEDDDNPESGKDAAAQNQRVTVRVKAMDETEKRIEVSLDEKVSDLKNKIRDQMDVPLDRQRLIYLGKQLKDNMTLGE